MAVCAVRRVKGGCVCIQESGRWLFVQSGEWKVAVFSVRGVEGGCVCSHESGSWQFVLLNFNSL